MTPHDAVREVVREVLKELRLTVEDRCGGHMAPTRRVLALCLGDEVIDEVVVATESFDESTGTWGMR